MRARRVVAAFIALLLVVPPVSANPLAFALANQGTAEDVSDPAASNGREAYGEPSGSGEIDSADLAGLGRRLTVIGLGYETFRDASNLDADAELLVDYTSPQGLIPNPTDRVQTLDHVYRALALLDYTQALRYPEGETCARANRTALLRSADGLFADQKTGELAPWLKAELKRSKAGEAPGNLISAAAREWTPIAYLGTLAEVRRLSRRLADKTVLAEDRAAAFCARAKLHEDLASAQSAVKWNDPDLSSQAQSVVEVRAEGATGAGTILTLDGKPIILIAARFARNAYEAPDVFARSGKKVPVAYLRRGAEFSLLSVEGSDGIPPLPFPKQLDTGSRVAYALGHPIQGGPWSVTRGLAKPDRNIIRADAAVDEGQAGGPLFDDHGVLIGIVAGPGVAFDLSTIQNWLKDGASTLPNVEAAQEMGTSALMTASAAFAPKDKGGLIEAGYNPSPRGVCVDSRGCGMPSTPSYGSGSYSYSGTYAGGADGNLFLGLLKIGGMILKGLSQRPPKKVVALPDNRRHAPPKAVTHQAPKPPPDPLRPSAIKLTVSRTTLVQGEEFEAVATISFTGTEGSVAGRAVSFTAVPEGKISCTAARTNTSGVARTTCTAIENARERSFDSLEDETRRRMGMKTPGRVRRTPAKGDDKVALLKEREASALGALDAEEEKHPGFGGTDTPGLVKPVPEAEIIEFEIKGDRVTFGASIDEYQDQADLDILERPCFGGSAPERAGEVGVVSRYRCRSDGPSWHSRIDERALSKAEDPSEDQATDEPGGKPAVESRPDNAPTGTKPIDQAGLTRPQIHAIKKRIEAGPKDWVGISPGEEVISTDSDGQAINNGPWENLTHHRK